MAHFHKMAFTFYLASFHNQTPIYKDFSVYIKLLVFTYLKTNDKKKMQGNYNTKVNSMSSPCTLIQGTRQWPGKKYIGCFQINNWSKWIWF